MKLKGFLVLREGLGLDGCVSVKDRMAQETAVVQSAELQEIVLCIVLAEEAARAREECSFIVGVLISL